MAERTGQRDAPTWARGETVVDIGLAVFVLVVVAAAIAADLGAGNATPDPLAYGFAVAMGALMLVRRQLPVAVAVVTGVALIAYYMLDYPPIGLAVPVAAALFTVAEAGRMGWAIGVATSLLAVSTGFRVATGDDVGYLFGYELATSVTLMAAVIALGYAVRARRELRAEGERRLDAMRLEREIEAGRRVAQERLRIARDLHDVLAHTLSVITVQADLAAEAVDDDRDAARAAVQTIRGTSRSASAEIRAVVQVLRDGGATDDAPAARAPIAGLADLDRLVEVTRAAGIDVRVATTGESVRLPLTVDTTALRILQEAMTNVRRHAGAASVQVGLDYGPRELTLRVVDDGAGAASATAGGPDGFGIRGMRERAELVGGTLEAGPRAGGGFAVGATLPITWNDGDRP